MQNLKEEDFKSQLNEEFTEEEKKAYCVTLSGRKVSALDPQPEDINLNDIATALGMTCRYGGMVPFHYSVAQHSSYVSNYAAAIGEQYALWGLMHDAAEAYIGDMRSPYKPLVRNFDAIEAIMLRVIADKFGLRWYDDSSQAGVPKAVKSIDTRIHYSEARQLLPGNDEWKVVPHIKESTGLNDFHIKPVHPEQATQIFLSMFSELYYKR